MLSRQRLRELLLMFAVLVVACAGPPPTGDAAVDRGAAPDEARADVAPDDLAPVADVASDGPKDAPTGLDQGEMDAVDAAPDADAATTDVGADVEVGVDARPSCWDCPPEWVPYDRGGCGPAVILCSPDGGAAPGACVGREPHATDRVDDGDGGTVVAFHRLADGGIGGGWPAAGWEPDAGIRACPTGWTPLDGACDPMLRADCPAGAGPLPGGACTSTSHADCPPGPYARVPAEASGALVIYVNPAAPASGADGTVEHPYPSLATASARVSGTAWWMLAAGEYREPLTLSRDAHLVGACPARTLLLGRGASPSEPTLLVRGAGVRAHIRGVSLTGAGPAVVARDGASLGIERVRWADGAAALLVEGAGSGVTVADAVIEGMRGAADRNVVVVRDGGALTAGRLHASQNAGTLLFVGPGGVVELTDALVADARAIEGATALNSSAARAEGAVIARARLRVSRAVFERQIGAAVVGLDADVEVTDSVMRATRPRSDGASGEGVVVDARATLTATDVLVEGNREHAVRASGTGTRATLTRCVVRGTRYPTLDAASVAGVYADGRANATLESCVVRENARANVAAASGATLALRDSIVRDGVRTPIGSLGSGVRSEDATVELERVLVAASRSEAVLATGPTGSVVVRDSVLRDTQDERVFGGLDSSGSGIKVNRAARGVLERVLLLRSETISALATDLGSSLTLRDSAVVSTRRQSDGVLGAGVAAVLGGAIRMQHVAVVGSHEIGVGAIFPGLTLPPPPSSISGDDVLILDTRPSDVRGFGIGLGASAGARVDLRRVAVDGAAGAAVAAMRLEIPPYPVALTSDINVADLFVRGVAASSTGFDARRPLSPIGPAQSLAVYTGAGSSASLGHAVLDGAQVAFSVAGSASVSRGVAAAIRGPFVRFASSTASRDGLPARSAFCVFPEVDVAVEEVGSIGTVDLPIPPPPIPGAP